MNKNKVVLAERVRCALAERKPVVALESTVIAHGLPAPLNLETALACEQAIEREGATAATVGIIDGVPTVGLSEDQLKLFAMGESARPRIEKVSLNNMAGVMFNRGWGATTVAATMRIAQAGGLRVFSTGGIGGVHRGATESWDVSADLTALAQIPLVCVCAGAKAILDLAKTIERLETLGVPVVGYRTREFPAFYSRASGLPVDISVQSPDEAALIAARHWESAGNTAVLVCVPVPEHFEIPIATIERAIENALEMAARQGVRGKAITPFLLARLNELTAGETLTANRALLLNNAQVAARIAVSLSRDEK